MTSSPSSGAADPAAAPVSPKLSAEQMLSRLLTLIRTSKSVAEFTPQRLREVMGVDVDYARDGSGRYGFGEKVSQDWVHGFEVDPRMKNHGFEFSFDPATPGSSPDMTSICQMDFDRFTGELEKMGFLREHYFDSPPQASFGEKLPHGALMYDLFQRPGMWIQVYPNGEANEPIEKISHLCVQMVLIG
ncbi:hypothetical protein [Xanthomonas sacchari]|uniref:hypothetical protein n=1 Tax=Xanthomonas sacchari TaxID=56458 RepID=UPI0020C539D1|nr:hypothetical protein [Xanthomonas sacchari]